MDGESQETGPRLDNRLAQNGARIIKLQVVMRRTRFFFVLKQKIQVENDLDFLFKLLLGITDSLPINNTAILRLYGVDLPQKLPCPNKSIGQTAFGWANFCYAP